MKKRVGDLKRSRSAEMAWNDNLLGVAGGKSIFNRIKDFFKYLKDDPKLDFNFLMDLTAVDYLHRKPQRFEVVYHLFSLKHNHRLRVKIPVDEDDCTIFSLTPLWKTANWYEREVWDLYGIRFSGHPDLRRILLYEEFKGHPLRKDYPINKRQPLIGPYN